MIKSVTASRLNRFSMKAVPMSSKAVSQLLLSQSCGSPFDVKFASYLHLPKAALLGQGCVSSGEAKNTYGTGEKQNW